MHGLKLWKNLGQKLYRDLGLSIKMLMHYHTDPAAKAKKCICSCCSDRFHDVGTNTDDLSDRAFVRPIVLQTDLDVEDVISAQKSDKDIGPIYSLKEDNSPQPTYKEISVYSQETKCYWGEWDRIVLKGGLLYRRWETADNANVYWQLILPRSFRQQVMRELHDKSGHLGQRWVYLAARRRFSWHKFR